MRGHRFTRVSAVVFHQFAILGVIRYVIRHRVDHGSPAGGTHTEARVITHGNRGASNVHADHRQAGCHRLQHGESAGIMQTGKDENIVIAVFLKNLLTSTRGLD
jgi:hypothetical protein